MISIIVATCSEEFLAKLTENVAKTIGVEHELIAIFGSDAKKGICRIYNEGAQKSIHPYLCFVHEDIIFHTKNWGEILINNFKEENIRLIGILGSVIKTKIPSNTYIPESPFNRHNQLQRYPDGKLIHCFENPLNEKSSKVAVIDGMFIACKKKTWSETLFSEHNFEGFHGYDIDFSLKNAQLGYNVVIYNILLEHLSFGNYNKHWIDAQLILKKKWNKYLPMFGKEVNPDEIKSAEIINLRELLKILINNNYLKLYQYILLFKLIILKADDPLLPFFIRRVILGNSLDFNLKRLLKKIINETPLRST